METINYLQLFAEAGSVVNATSGYVNAATGATESYQNGANQKGQKASAELQAYTALIKQYNTISERLEKMLPAEAAKSKLAEILAA